MQNKTKKESETPKRGRSTTDPVPRTHGLLIAIAILIRMYTRGTARVPYIPYPCLAHATRTYRPNTSTEIQATVTTTSSRPAPAYPVFSSLLTLDWPALFRFLCPSNTKFARPHGLFLHTRMLPRKEYQPDTADALRKNWLRRTTWGAAQPPSPTQETETKSE